MMKPLSVLILFLLFLACNSSDQPPEIAFYHWKAKANYTPSIADNLEGVKKIYLHYFDVAYDKERNKVYPTYVVKEVDKEYKQYEIIPVVFIVNEVIKKGNIESICKDITRLIQQINQHHFEQSITHIQIDCDWTQSTREKYFQLLALLKKEFEVSVTIRLHQIKYQAQTGIPPVDRGALMLYNMGDLKDENQNSILETEIVKDYINENTRYPIKLDVALPLFSQVVIKNNEGRLRLLKGTHQEELRGLTNYFEQIADNVYTVKRDTLFKGFYLYEGYTLKVEEIAEEEVIQSYRIVRESQLNLEAVIFYHLDEAVFHQIDFKLVRRGLI